LTQIADFHNLLIPRWLPGKIAACDSAKSRVLYTNDHLNAKSALPLQMLDNPVPISISFH